MIQHDRPLVASLGYIGIESAHVDEWRTFSLEVLGLQIGAENDDGSLGLRIDDRPSRITIHPAQRDGLAYIGWDVADAKALLSVFEALRDAACNPRWATSEECERRMVQELVLCTDPAGMALEFSRGSLTLGEAFQPARPLSGFLTGPLGLGHLVVDVSDLKAATRFYCDVLGFRLRDQLGSVLSFLGCNERHHSIGLAHLGGEPRLLHIMLEVESLDDVGTTLDICIQRKLKASTIGLHTNDRTTSFYVATPSGFEIEYGWGGLLVDDASWLCTKIDRPSIWGHWALDPDRPPQPRAFRQATDT